jgi:hypothetical protein
MQTRRIAAARGSIRQRCTHVMQRRRTALAGEHDPSKPDRGLLDNRVQSTIQGRSRLHRPEQVRRRGG